MNKLDKKTVIEFEKACVTLGYSPRLVAKLISSVSSKKSLLNDTAAIERIYIERFIDISKDKLAITYAKNLKVLWLEKINYKYDEGSYERELIINVLKVVLPNDQCHKVLSKEDISSLSVDDDVESLYDKYISSFAGDRIDIAIHSSAEDARDLVYAKSQNYTDQTTFTNRYRCQCLNPEDALCGRLNDGRICPKCGKPVKYVGDDVIDLLYKRQLVSNIEEINKLNQKAVRTESGGYFDPMKRFVYSKRSITDPFNKAHEVIYNNYLAYTVRHKESAISLRERNAIYLASKILMKLSDLSIVDASKITKITQDGKSDKVIRLLISAISYNKSISMNALVCSIESILSAAAKNNKFDDAVEVVINSIISASNEDFNIELVDFSDSSISYNEAASLLIAMDSLLEDTPDFSKFNTIIESLSNEKKIGLNKFISLNLKNLLYSMTTNLFYTEVLITSELADAIYKCHKYINSSCATKNKNELRNRITDDLVDAYKAYLNLNENYVATDRIINSMQLVADIVIENNLEYSSWRRIQAKQIRHRMTLFMKKMYVYIDCDGSYSMLAISIALFILSDLLNCSLHDSIILVNKAKEKIEKVQKQRSIYSDIKNASCKELLSAFIYVDHFTEQRYTDAIDSVKTYELHDTELVSFLLYFTLGIFVSDDCSNDEIKKCIKCLNDVLKNGKKL